MATALGRTVPSTNTSSYKRAMEPNKKVAVRRVTPTSSKAWKERVKNNVIQRLRSNTRSLQKLLHEELERNSVMVDSPCVEQDDTNYDFAISEEELLQLQEEIERDRELERIHYEEELIELAQSQEQYLLDQIDAYEHTVNNDKEEESVLCPICRDNYLTTGISCPGTMDGSCSLDVRTNLGVMDLKEILGMVYERHSMAGCSGELIFYMQSNHLQAACSICETNHCLI